MFAVRRPIRRDRRGGSGGVGALGAEGGGPRLGGGEAAAAVGTSRRCLGLSRFYTLERRRRRSKLFFFSYLSGTWKDFLAKRSFLKGGEEISPIKGSYGLHHPEPISGGPYLLDDVAQYFARKLVAFTILDLWSPMAANVTISAPN